MGNWSWRSGAVGAVLALTLLAFTLDEGVSFTLHEWAALGNARGYGTVHKFGRAPSAVATGDDIWDCHSISGPATIPAQPSAFSLYASSDAAGDTTQTIRVYGIAADGEAVVEDVALDGLSTELVGTAANWLNVYRAKNISATALAGNVYLSPDIDHTLGVPDDWATTARACITIGNEQTLMAYYVVPTNRQGLLEKSQVGVSADATTGKTARLVMTVQEPGGVFQVKDDVDVLSTGQGIIEIEPKSPIVLAPGSVVKWSVVAPSANTAAFANFDILLVPEQL